MTDLQLTLVILGVFIIGGVVAYNWIQERKLRKEVTSEFIVPQKDVLADDFMIDADAYVVDKEMAEVAQKFEPAVNAKSQPEIKTPSFAPPKHNDLVDIEEIEIELNEPVAQEKPTAEVSSAKTTTAAPLVKEHLESKLPSDIHPQIDLTAILYATNPIKSSSLASLGAALQDIHGLPTMMHGLDDAGKWTSITDKNPDLACKQVACTIQLADRGGPISRVLLNKFQFAVEEMGLELNAHVEWQGSGDAMQRAVDLDNFCMEVDQIISVHLVENEAPMHGTKIRSLAEANGLTLLSDGKFHYFADHSAEILAFQLLDGNSQPFTPDNMRTSVVKGLTFQIEIPKVSNCELVFNKMIEIAQRMNASLKGNLVDDHQKPLGDLQIEKIRQQLRVIHATMVARGVMPGSPSSMRLFN